MIIMILILVIRIIIIIIIVIYYYNYCDYYYIGTLFYLRTVFNFDFFNSYLCSASRFLFIFFFK